MPPGATAAPGAPWNQASTTPAHIDWTDLRGPRLAAVGWVKEDNVKALFEYFVYKATAVMALVATASTLMLLLVLWGVSVVESRQHRPTPFEVEIRQLSDAPLWVVLVAGLLVLNGITMARWTILSAEVGRRRGPQGYEVVLPLPLGKVTAFNILYIGLAVLLFYTARSALQ